MPICPKCGATVPEGAIFCGKCGATLGSPQPAPVKPFESQAPQSTSSQTPSSTLGTSRTDSSQLSTRLEKALRKTELLSYAVIGLSVLIVIILILLLA